MCFFCFFVFCFFSIFFFLGKGEKGEQRAGEQRAGEQRAGEQRAERWVLTLFFRELRVRSDLFPSSSSSSQDAAVSERVQPLQSLRPQHRFQLDANSSLVCQQICGGTNQLTCRLLCVRQSLCRKRNRLAKQARLFAVSRPKWRGRWFFANYAYIWHHTYRISHTSDKLLFEKPRGRQRRTHLQP